MAKVKSPRPAVLDWPRTFTFEDGRVLNAGDEFTVKGEGRYRMKYMRPNGEITCWGPINTKGLTPEGGLRSFKIEDISVVHDKSKSQKTLRKNDEDNTAEDVPDDVW